ncbi:helix-turn-helix transcriptional regulator [Cyanobacteria bacterium FACHB-63]|nr:helix-turn-helix transcriptional regulator [Cyanobacteria bacterium FACHB-63]
MTLPGTTLTFGEWLRVKRQRKGDRQKDLARALKLSTQTVSSWENDDSIPKLTPLQMRILCNQLDCSLDELAQYQEIAEKAS